MRSLDFIKRIAVYYLNIFNKRQLNVWVFGEWFGKRTGDNVTYLANYIAENYTDVQLYWLCDKECDTSRLHSRIIIIDYTTKEAVNVLKHASVAFMGEGISDLNPEVHNYLGNAIKVNLWHGIMWKKIGLDAEKNKKIGIVGKIRKIIYRYDYFESPSNEYSSHIKTAFDSSDTNIIQSGLPRNVVFHDIEKVEECRKSLVNRLNISNPIIVSYLPTFRDSKSNSFSFVDVEDSTFEQWLQDNNVYIIQKAHAAEKGGFGSDKGHIITIEDITAQELMAASDILVTDYSSCFFDFLILDRPIIHFLYDYDYYKEKDRGLYYEKEEVICGPTPNTIGELIEVIKRSVLNPVEYKDLRRARREKFLTYENPDSCKIIAEFIITQNNKKARRNR